MQRSDNWLEAWLFDQLYIAYIEARKHKRSTRDEHTFELNDMRNLLQLTEDIINRRYKPGRGVAFIVRDPVMREIFAAPFRDRVVHHFLYNMVYEWWDRRFIYDSYSCRIGKGTLLGVRRLQHHINQVMQNGQREAMVIKLDIQGYFMSLPRREIYLKIKWGLERQFPEEQQKWLKSMLLFLWREVIFDDPTKGVRIRGSIADWKGLPDNKSLFRQPPGRGIVIGNLSSQLISNIYLDQLDRYIRFELGYKHYGRYVDDFYIVLEKEKLAQGLADVKKINDYLRGMKLTLHPNKRHIQDVRKGVPFLGTVVYPRAIVAGKRFKGNFYQALMHYQLGLVDENSVISYLGYLKNINGKKLAKEMFDRVGFEYRY